MTDQPTNGAQPLLDLADLAESRPFIRGADGKAYYLRTEGLGGLDHHRLMFLADRDNALLEKDPGTLTDEQRKQEEEGLSEMLELILDAPARVRKGIKGQHVRRLVRHFHNASDPDMRVYQEIQGLLAGALAAQEEMQATEPEESSTTES